MSDLGNKSFLGVFFGENTPKKSLNSLGAKPLYWLIVKHLQKVVFFVKRQKIPEKKVKKLKT
jgi:hypothetical protein